MKKLITLNFSDFWSSFEKTNNYLYHLLSRYYEVQLSEEPEFLIYSVFGEHHRQYNKSVKVFFTGENVLPDFTECDYAITFAYINSDRNYRFPLYGWWYSQNGGSSEPLERLTVPRQLSADTVQQKDFCSFVVSNPYCKARNQFFQKLSRYKKVNSGGKYLNNIGGPVQNKTEFLQRHKFTIAFENSSTPGYTTEKLVDAYLAGTVPIYWGNPLIGQDFNKKAFICVNDFSNFDQAIQRIIELDNDDEQLLDMLNQPLFENRQLNPYVREENLMQFFDFVFATGHNQNFVADPNYWVALQSAKTIEGVRRLVPSDLKQTIKTLVGQ